MHIWYCIRVLYLRSEDIGRVCCGPHGPITIVVICSSSRFFRMIDYTEGLEKAESDQTRPDVQLTDGQTGHLVHSGRYLSLVPKVICLILNNLRTIPLQNSMTARGIIIGTKTSNNIQIEMNYI